MKPLSSRNRFSFPQRIKSSEEITIGNKMKPQTIQVTKIILCAAPMESAAGMRGWEWVRAKDLVAIKQAQVAVSIALFLVI